MEQSNPIYVEIELRTNKPNGWGDNKGIFFSVYLKGSENSTLLSHTQNL